MTNETAQFVWEQVECFLRGDAGRRFDIGKPASFETLLQVLRPQDLEQLAALAEDAYRLVAAMRLLDPGADGAPPADVREPLLDLARRLEPDGSHRGARAMELAITYGCGWRRQWRPRGDAWEQRWPNAVQALSPALEPAVTQARLWLEQHVVNYPSGNDHI